MQQVTDKAGTQVVMITNENKQSESSQRNTKNNGQGNRGNNNRRQNGWNNRQQGNNQDQYTGQPVTSCDLCSLIKEN